jgi:hypothetical protein
MSAHDRLVATGRNAGSRMRGFGQGDFLQAVGRCIKSAIQIGAEEARKVG